MNAILKIINSSELAQEIWGYDPKFTKDEWDKVIITMRDNLQNIYNKLSEETGGNEEIYSLGDVINLLNVLELEVDRRKNMNEKQRLFVDMDGTLAVFNQVDTLEKLYEPGYFASLSPHTNVIEAVRQLQQKDDIEVYILSAVLSDSKYALQEKNEWLDKYLPGTDEEHRIFVPFGEIKGNYVPNGIRESDILLDDYTINLKSWEPPARGLKLLNGINGTHGTWTGGKIAFNNSSEELVNKITQFVRTGIIESDELSETENISMERLEEIASLAVDGLIQDNPEEAKTYFDETMQLTDAEKQFFGISDDNELQALEAEDLMEWAVNNSTMDIEIEAAECLLNYMEGHGYSILCDRNGNLYRKDLCDDESPELYSLSDMVYAVSEWNTQLLEAEENNEDNPLDIEKIAALKRDESILDELSNNVYHVYSR